MYVHLNQSEQPRSLEKMHKEVQDSHLFHAHNKQDTYP